MKPYSYLREHDFIRIYINDIPDNEYTLGEEKEYDSEHHYVVEFRSIDSDMLAYIEVFDFSKTNLSVIENLYPDYKHWDELKQFQNSLQKGDH